jgi:hypothetical protein
MSEKISLEEKMRRIAKNTATQCMTDYSIDRTTYLELQDMIEKACHDCLMVGMALGRQLYKPVYGEETVD